MLGRRKWSPSRTREALMEQTLSVGATAGVMRGMRGVVLGLANNRSIAWGIAKAAQAAGAELAFTFQGQALEKRVRPLAQELGAHVLGHCDVTDGRLYRFGVRGSRKVVGRRRLHRPLHRLL